MVRRRFFEQEPKERHEIAPYRGFMRCIDVRSFDLALFLTFPYDWLSF